MRQPADIRIAKLGATTLVVAALVVGCAPEPRSYFDLVEEWPLAHWMTTTRLIDVGTPEGRAHLGAGWSGQDELWTGDWSFAWSDAPSSEVHFHVLGDEPRAVRLWCRPAIGEDTRLSVLLNGHELETLELQAGLHSYRVRVPGGVTLQGLNVLELRSSQQAPPSERDWRRRGIALESVRLVTGDQPGESEVGTEPVDEPRDDVPDDGAGAGHLSLAAGTRVDYYPRVQPDSTVYLRAPAGRNHPQALLGLTIASENGELARHDVAASDLVGGVRLPVEGAGLRRVSLEVVGNGVSGRPFLLSAAHIETVSAAPSASAEGPPAAGVVGPRPNVIVYLIDTLRADHLGAYGYSEPTSPQIDAFAADALVFEQLIAQSGWTRTSVASLLTGLRATSHGVYQRTDNLAAEAVTLPGLLGEAGYRTVGVITNGIISPKHGFDNGFDDYLYLTEQKTDQVHRYSDEVHDAFLGWLDGRPDNAPFFAYLHTMDVHGPYTPPSPFREQFAPPGPRSGLRYPRHARALEMTGAMTEDEVRADMVALYDAEIAHQDQRFGELMEELRERGLYDNTVIMLVSDHGEEFLDHGRYEHLHTIYQEIVRVPLIVRVPGGPRGARIPGRVQHIDLLPTILDMAGAETPPWAQGDSLAGLLRDPDAAWPDRPIATRMRVDAASLASIIYGDWHLIRAPMESLSAHPLNRELYDLVRDPAELESAAAERRILAGWLLTELARLERSDVALLEPEYVEIDPELEERLRDLGYIR